jgi:hypothetical protein
MEVYISLDKNRHKMPAKNRMWEEKESGKYLPDGPDTGALKIKIRRHTSTHEIKGLLKRH